MKKLAFIFDTVMLKDENEDYYAINLNYRLWEDRYLKSFDYIIVSTRVKNVQHMEIMEKKGYTISNGKNVEIRPISAYRKLTDIFFKKESIKKQLEEIIEKVDCVIVRLPSPLGNLACDVCREHGKKYALEMVACAWDGYRNHGHWAGKLVAPYMYFETKKQCKKAGRVLYVTKDFLQQRYPTKGITANASNVMLCQSDEIILTRRIERIKKNKEGTFVLGLVGPLELEAKGHKVALGALEILAKKFPNIRMEFLGAGSGYRLERLIRKKKLTDKVCFKGTLPSGDSVLRWMDTLDILVIPSFQEGLPRALIEAMSRGCPAVGAITGGIPELIDQNLLHRPGDYRKLADDIEKLLENEEMCIQAAKRNFENAKQYAKENLDSRRTKFWNEFAGRE
ncbi:MAG: glycosyltransferase family 4 protein [Lachnospiraceae bacterium]|nr:glycosyltransferase family 4 protein [Lachnospiraceae bacterium]